MSATFGFMSGFVPWALSILAVVVTGTVLDIFLSEKKLGKAVRGVFASLTVLIIVSPLPALLSGCKSFDLSSFSEEISLDRDYLNYAEAQKRRALEDGLAAALADKGYKNVACEVTAQFGTTICITLVRLDLSALVISAPATNINKTENIRALAAEFLKIDRGKVVINE
ncbi:MAG: hypothetical protein FWE84_04800 [Firmicutes bacterium]|nr:hypothetical protein [Bacillota bacterium]